jgi:outer membrane protein assembly factor BamB
MRRILAAVLLGLAAATSTPFFNVTLSKNADGPPQYFIAAVPGVAAVANMIHVANSNLGSGLLTAVDNATGKPLWSMNVSSTGFGEGVGTLSDRFVVLNSDAQLTAVSAVSGAILWSKPAPVIPIAQAFAVHAASDVVAYMSYEGTVMLLRGTTGEVIWTASVAVAPWVVQGYCSVSLSDQFVVAVFYGALFTFSTTGSGTPLYQQNVTESFSFASPRYAIAGDTFVFCTQATVSTLQLSTGTVTTIGTLNTTQYSYNEVVIAPSGLQMYILAMDGSFVATARGNLGNNMPMLVTANSVRDGSQAWEWFTDDTVSFLTVVNQELICFVTTGGPVALWTKNGLLASSAAGGLDYSESAPPLLYQAHVWYYASEFYQSFPETINFIGVVSDL